MRFASKKPCVQHGRLSGEGMPELHCLPTSMHLLAEHDSQIHEVLYT